MSTTRIRLDTQLVNDARSSAVLMDRSAKEQIEIWSRLGRVAETVFGQDRIRALNLLGQIRGIDALIAAIDTREGRKLALIEIQRAGTAAKDYSAKIGFHQLINEEGGVLSGKEAAALYGGRPPATEATVRKAARLGQLIAVKDGRGHMLFPRWQFSTKGGAIPGLDETMKVLRRHPHFHDLLPFTFLLNRSARLGGKRPVDLLRTAKRANIRLVVDLAAQAGE